MDKEARLRELARKRQRASWPGYANVGDYHGGAYECLHVSPYTKSASNRDAAVMVLLQDWSSDKFLSGPLDADARDIGHTPTLPTNRNLRRHLRQHLDLELSDTYATNLFPFIKTGGLSDTIPMKDLVRAAQEFAIPQIQTVQPRVVICLGLNTFNAVRRAVGLKPVTPLAEALNCPFDVGMSKIWCQAHTGARGQNNRNAGDRTRVDRDWQRMAEAIGVVAN